MARRLMIRVDAAALRVAAAGHPLALQEVRGDDGAPSASAAEEIPVYREGGHARRLVEWAKRRGRTFAPPDAAKALGIRRSHASKVLRRVVNDPGPVVRLSRGQYGIEGMEPDALPYREGSHARRLVEWAHIRGQTFAPAELAKALGIRRSHASRLLRRVVDDPGPVVRLSRGRYGLEGMEPDALPYREGSHARRLVEWAESRGRTFAPPDAAKALGIRRTHASRLLRTAVSHPGPVVRHSRGLYGLEGTEPDVPPYREGSIPRRLVEWATGHGRAFTTGEVEKDLGVNRAPVANALSRIVKGGGPIRRVARGVYAIEGEETEIPTYRAGSRPRQLVDWAERRGRTFTAADAGTALGLTRTHVTKVLRRVVADGGSIRRVARGVYAIGCSAEIPTPSRPQPKKAKRKPSAKRRTATKRGKKRATKKPRTRRP